VHSRRQKENVLGADERNVFLQDRKIPWPEVSKPQFVRFVENYLKPNAAKRSVRGEQYLATAIYCYENGGKEAAAAFKAKALDAAPFLQKKADLLIPDE
jgi:hypothetical protein